MSLQPVLLAGQWRASESTGSFRAYDPQAATPTADEYPVSSWADCDTALAAAVEAFRKLREVPGGRVAEFLERYADRIEARSNEICQLASQETALPVEPRLASGELPRTTGQLRQAAQAARSDNWRLPVIDSQSNIRSYYAALGPVAVFGPNNFPLAFGSASGGDFAAAIAAGNPVIAKANPMHPGTTRLLAEEAHGAAGDTAMPAGTVQMIYRTSHADGERLVADARLGAVGYTGSRAAGLKLKAAADAVGKPIYVELSSVNPVFILSGALDERCEEIADEFTTSCLMGTGQFCTSPGIVMLPAGELAERFMAAVGERFKAAAVGTLLSKSGEDGLAAAVEQLQQAGAQIMCGGAVGGGAGYSYQNTLLRVEGETFLRKSSELQTEAFGNASMFVTASTIEQMADLARALEGNLTGCLYSAQNGRDDEAYNAVAPHLRQRVGRLLNDKMPTGVAVTSAMNHGGPFPATGHPGFTAVGTPGSMLRFAMLQCFDNVRASRLPAVLRDENPDGVWRLIDGEWTRADA
jgi:NADP-dependent aldehyde dehydrogenase